jgi:hypothetical protein
MLVCFIVFRRLMRKHLVILADVASRCISSADEETLGYTHRSDSPVRAL